MIVYRDIGRSAGESSLTLVIYTPCACAHVNILTRAYVYMQEASRCSEHWVIIFGRQSLAYFAKFAQSQFIGPG